MSAAIAAGLVSLVGFDVDSPSSWLAPPPSCTGWPPGMHDADGRVGAQLKLWPQPHVRLALGLVIANPDWLSPSL